MEYRVCTSHRLVEEIQSGMRSLVLIDVRPTTQYSVKHITQAENLNLSKILIRRLLKGVVTFRSMLQNSPSLLGKLGESQRPRIVLYDLESNADCPQAELLRHAEVFSSCFSVGDRGCSDVYILDGGLNAFETLHPELCVTSDAPSRKRPTALSQTCTPVSLTAIPPTSKFQFDPFVNAAPETKEEDERYGPPVEILPYVVLGCERDSSNLQVLQRLGITAVLNISHNCRNHFQSLFEYMDIPVEDTHHSDVLSKLEKAFEFIEYVQAKGGKVFIHCHAGVSRSPTVCIAYLMKLHHWNLSQAYDYVKARRPRISPNLHFMGQLLVFQKQLESERSARDAQCVVATCARSSYSPKSCTRIQARSSSAPSVFIPNGSQALDLLDCQCRPQTQLFETCKTAANKGLNNLSSTPKFPITP